MIGNRAEKYQVWDAEYEAYLEGLTSIHPHEGVIFEARTFTLDFQEKIRSRFENQEKILNLILDRNRFFYAKGRSPRKTRLLRIFENSHIFKPVNRTQHFHHDYQERVSQDLDIEINILSYYSLECYEGKWEQKKNPKQSCTFFPSQWSKRDVAEDIVSSWHNYDFTSLYVGNCGCRFEGDGDSGIRIVTFLDREGIVQTAYPKRPHKPQNPYSDRTRQATFSMDISPPKTHAASTPNIQASYVSSSTSPYYENGAAKRLASNSASSSQHVLHAAGNTKPSVSIVDLRAVNNPLPEAVRKVNVTAAASSSSPVQPLPKVEQLPQQKENTVKKKTFLRKFLQFIGVFVILGVFGKVLNSLKD